MCATNAPWGASDLLNAIDEHVASIPRTRIDDASAVAALHATATFHLDFLQHHLSHPLFPADEPVAPFGADAKRRYVSTFVASTRQPHTDALNHTPGVALSAVHIHAPGGKPVMSQSALHGFHVFEGMQLRWERAGPDAVPTFGYAMRETKIAKLVDGIIRLRFAVHLLKAAASVAHLQFLRHPDGPTLSARYKQLSLENLSARRAQAAEQVRAALSYFVTANRAELESLAEASTSEYSFVYVRVEAQGGDRDAIGQGPVGVGQSTLQILGQYAAPATRPASLVINSQAPPRMHTLAGPCNETPVHKVLCNAAAHHGNMGHQHLSAEMALPHGSDMLLHTAETGADSRSAGTFVAETNFSNVAFLHGDTVRFPASSSATYGLMQHVLRDMLQGMVDRDLDTRLKRVVHEPMDLVQFVRDLREGKVSAACVLGSMPAIRLVERVTVDESLSGGEIRSYALDESNAMMLEISSKFQRFVGDSVVWEA